MRQIFFCTLFSFLLVCYFVSERESKPPSAQELVAVTQAVQMQVDEIDQQIAELQKMKRGYESRARRHEDQAERLQFEDQALLETRRHLQLADENRMKAERIQEEIDKLQRERAKLAG